MFWLGSCVCSFSIAIGAMATTGAAQDVNVATTKPMLLNPLSAIKPSELSAFLEQPLFIPSRQAPPSISDPPQSSEPSEPELKADEEPPKIRLVGIVQASGARTALLQRSNARTVSRVRLGDELDGWLVTSVEAAGVRLKRGDREQEYRLFAKGTLSVDRHESVAKVDAGPTSTAANDEDLEAGTGYSLEFGSENDPD
jgi:hypothetical protein